MTTGKARADDALLELGESAAVKRAQEWRQRAQLWQGQWRWKWR